MSRILKKYEDLYIFCEGNYMLLGFFSSTDLHKSNKCRCLSERVYIILKCLAKRCSNMRQVPKVKEPPPPLFYPVKFQDNIYSSQLFDLICILNRYWYIIRTFSILSYTNSDISHSKFVYDNYGRVKFLPALARVFI